VGAASSRDDQRYIPSLQQMVPMGKKYVELGFHDAAFFFALSSGRCHPPPNAT